MKVGSFHLDVSYMQIAVFNSNLQNPFNDWSDEQFEAGYSWRESSVSFKTAEQNGLHYIDIYIQKKFTVIKDRAIKCFDVPFLLNLNNEIILSSVLSECTVKIPANKYTMRYELIDDNGNYQIMLTFATDEHYLFKSHHNS